MEYTDADVEGLDESTLSFWKNSGGDWSTTGDSSVSAGSNYVIECICYLYPFSCYTIGIFAENPGFLAVQSVPDGARVS